jgi:hypothetical protein
MKRGSWADYPELFMARSRRGVIKAATLRKLEMDNRTIYRRCQPDGPWRRLAPGVILLQSSPPSQEQRVEAALLYGGPHAVLTGSAACVKQGMRSSQLPAGNEVQILLPHTDKRLSSGFVVIERTRRMPTPVIYGGLPMAPTLRAVLDAARRYKSPDDVAKMLIEAIHRGRCSPTDLAAELDEGSQRGTAIPRRVLAQVGDLRSVAELHGKRLAMRLPVPPSHWNVVLRGPNGEFIGCPDAWWIDVAMAWEIDSREHHGEAEAYEKTLERNSRYARFGITLVTTSPSRIRDDPAGVIAELAAAYEAAAARFPRPSIAMELPAA